MRTKIVVAIVVLVVVIGGLTSYALYSLYFAPAWTVVKCPQYGCSPGGEQIIMEGYNFPVGGPLTVSLMNTGAVVENLAGAHYFLCTVGINEQESCVSETFSGNCGTFVSPGATCQATITVSGLVSASGYVFKLITPYGAIFRYSVFEGVQGGPFSQGGPSPTPDINMIAYNFPLGGPLTATIKNIGYAPVDLADASYSILEVPDDGGNQVPLIGGNCGTAVAIGDSCQAILDVSALKGTVESPFFVPGTKYVFAVELLNETFSTAFKFAVTYGGSWQ